MPAQANDVDTALEEFTPSETGLLDPGSSIPLYYQVYRFLKRFIEQGSLRQGDRFPSEEAIAAKFGVSRPTANRAVEELVSRGWLARARGRGTFVQDQQLGSLALLSENLSLTEQFPPDAVLRTQFIQRSIRATEPAACELLQLPDNSPILHMRRLRSVNGQPVMVCDSYLSGDRFADLTEDTFVRGSLYATLEEVYGYTIERSERKISAQELVDQAVGELLGVPLFSPVLLLTGLTFVKEEDAPIESMISYVRECVTFANTVKRKAKSGLSVESGGG